MLKRIKNANTTVGVEVPDSYKNMTERSLKVSK